MVVIFISMTVVSVEWEDEHDLTCTRCRHTCRLVDGRNYSALSTQHSQYMYQVIANLTCQYPQPRACHLHNRWRKTQTLPRSRDVQKRMSRQTGAVHSPQATRLITHNSNNTWYAKKPRITIIIASWILQPRTRSTTQGIGAKDPGFSR
jgi:hypothetical protein